MLIRVATVLLAALVILQILYSSGKISVGFGTWQPILVAYAGWSIALCTGLVLRDGETGWRALFVLPAILFTLALVIFPTFFGFYIALSDWNLQSATGRQFNGLDNVARILAFNGGTHSNPTFAGDTVFAWTDVLEKIDLGRPDAGALRLRLVGVKNSDPNTEDQPFKVTDDKGRERYHPNVVLDLDYTVLMPRRR